MVMVLVYYSQLNLPGDIWKEKQVIVMNQGFVFSIKPMLLSDFLIVSRFTNANKLSLLISDP